MAQRSLSPSVVPPRGTTSQTRLSVPMRRSLPRRCLTLPCFPTGTSNCTPFRSTRPSHSVSRPTRTWSPVPTRSTVALTFSPPLASVTLSFRTRACLSLPITFWTAAHRGSRLAPSRAVVVCSVRSSSRARLFWTPTVPTTRLSPTCSSTRRTTDQPLCRLPSPPFAWSARTRSTLRSTRSSRPTRSVTLRPWAVRLLRLSLRLA